MVWRLKNFLTDTSRAHCSFEFTYFAHPSSNMEGRNIYISRKNIGKFLAKKFPIKDADLVIPVPDSARPAALGYAQELGVSFDEGCSKTDTVRKGHCEVSLNLIKVIELKLTVGLFQLVK